MFSLEDPLLWMLAAIALAAKAALHLVKLWREWNQKPPSKQDLI